MRIVESSLTRLENTGGQIRLAGGAGGFVFDERGRSYYDFILGYGPVVVGHSDPAFRSSLQKYEHEPIHLSTYTWRHQELLDVFFADWPFDSICAFFKTSSEAVTAATRVLATERERWGVLRCGYTGWHDAQIAWSPRWHEPPSSPARGEVRYGDWMRGTSGEELVGNWVDLRIESLEAEIARNGDHYAAFVLDAYQAAFIELDTVDRAIDLCRAAGIGVVFDETKTAGRVTRLGALHSLVEAGDLVILGKAIANGSPLSMLVGPVEFEEHYERARVGGTFCKELTAIHAALATYEVMTERDGFALLGRSGTVIADTLNSAAAVGGAAEFVTVLPVLGGSIIDVRLLPPLLGRWAPKALLSRSLADRGVLLLQGHPSFICLGHAELDLEDLHSRAVAAFSSWIRALEKP